MSEPFDPADAEAWIAHGRRPEHAAILANTWRRYPDLPADAVPEARLARMRERVIALRPVMESMSRTVEEERQARNFTFTATRIASGAGDDRDHAIIRARDIHGYDWNQAVRYAAGWYAAHAGWEPEARRPGPSVLAAEAYDHGFRDGGGNRDDLFDTARRALTAAPSASSLPSTIAARPLPSTWLKPSDTPRPTRWSRRLLILGGPETGLLAESSAVPAEAAVLLPMLRACLGHEEATVVVIAGTGFHALNNLDGAIAPLAGAEAASRLAGDGAHQRKLRALFGAGDFDDILVAAQGDYLALLDAHAGALPLCRTMERTRNTALQQRAHFRTWLDRGLRAGETIGAGHIRWGKAIKGLTGRLGEFTARYAGKRPTRGHRIVIETEDGKPAEGFFSATGEPLACETVISSRAQLRSAMAARLRAFGGATRLAPSVPPIFPSRRRRCDGDAQGHDERDTAHA